MRLLRTDRDYDLYEAHCPSCGAVLMWSIAMPPVPGTFYFWHDPSRDDARITECPRCESELPTGDLRVTAVAP